MHVNGNCKINNKIKKNIVQCVLFRPKNKNAEHIQSAVFDKNYGRKTELITSQCWMMKRARAEEKLNMRGAKAYRQLRDTAWRSLSRTHSKSQTVKVGLPPDRY